MALRVVNGYLRPPRSSQLSRIRPSPALTATQLSSQELSSQSNNNDDRIEQLNFTGASRVWPSYQHTKAAPDHVVPEFGNTREAYRSKSFFELLRQYVVFKAFTYQYLVDNNKSVSVQAACIRH